jgi:hypothetical protein
MSLRIRLAVSTAALLLMFGSPAGAQGSSSAPTVTVQSTTLALGQRVLVQGDGWPARTLVHISLCGNAAANLSADCDLVHQADAGVGDNGHFSTLLTVADPGKPCPCVVRVTDATATGEARVVVDVVGLPTATPLPVPLPDNSQQLEITEARVEGKGDWTAWFGAGSPRTLVLTVHNSGVTPVPDPPFNLVYGKGENPTGIVSAPHLGSLGPGQSVTVRVPFGVDTFSFGDYTIKGQIQGPGRSTVFRSKTSAQFPWGLFLVGVVLLQLVLLAIRNRVRRRVHRDEAPPLTETAVVDAEAVEPPLSDEPANASAVDEAAQVAVLASSLRADADALLGALAQRSDDMQRANAELDEEATAASRRVADDAAVHRAVIVERHRLARLNLGATDDQALELLSAAETSATSMIADAERRARMLVDRAHVDAAALLLRATPPGFDGVVNGPSSPVIDVTDEVDDTYLPPFEYDPRSDERGP